MKDELDRLQDKGDLESGRVSDLKQELHTTKEQMSHYQDETRRLDKEVSQLQSQLSEEQVIHKRLSMFFTRHLHPSCRIINCGVGTLDVHFCRNSLPIRVR